ncbi:MAG: glutamate racemase [Turicibacter sp.]|nr:glutamate racemase [Turicibacter sp.]
MKIGFLDSGLGGLTVLAHAIMHMPGGEFIYYADSDNAPYGSKTPEEVLELVLKGVKKLVGEGAGAVVLACNTATSIAAPTLREIYDIPIIGMEPAVKPAIEISKPLGLRVLVTATPLTCREKKMQDLLKALDGEEVVDLVALPSLVGLAEGFEFSDEEVIPYLMEQFAGMDPAAYGSVVLGCTHFPYFKKQIQGIFKGAVLVDGAEGTIRHLQKHVPVPSRDANALKISYFVSGQPVLDPTQIKKYSELMARVAANCE